MNLEGDMTMRLFMQKVVAATDLADIFSSLFKSVLFGFAIGIVGCYKGYKAEGGTAGVGLAANSAVVAASFLIFIMDLVAVQLTQLIFY
jgi:phospholipid/cholesterol/gamma-HCH transport system permease protein